MSDPREWDRYDELATDDALVGLDEQEKAELEELARALGAADLASYERAAAAVAVASVGKADRASPMPAHLTARVVDAGLRATARDVPARLDRTVPIAGAAPSRGPAARTVHLPGSPSVPPRALGPLPPPSSITPTPAGPPERVEPVASIDAARRRREGVWIGAAAGGWLAAAACLLLVVTYAWRERDARVGVGETPSATTSVAVTPSAAPPKAEPTPEQARAELLAKGADRSAWTATKDPASRGADGDVVWSAQEQRGYMRMHGLAKNDPTAYQYQLWIFDADRDDKFPVDGGVFDVKGDEVVVPVTARLPVGKAVLFAVTIEKPGGVVVSKRERIVLTAKPAAG